MKNLTSRFLSFNRQNFLFCRIVFFCLLIIVTKNSIADETDKFDSEDLFAHTSAEKVVVLSKAEETLKWVTSLSNDEIATTPAEIFRTKISPIELMQAAAMLREQNKLNTSIKLREILSYLNPTSAECFDIEARLGDAVLDAFKNDAELPQVKSGGNGGWNGVGLTSSDFIRKGAELFLQRDLTAAEKIATMNSQKSPLDLMKTIDLLASTGRPALARHYMKQFLDTKNTPEQCAEIIDNIGMKRLMQIAVNKKFMPRGEELANLILREAKKHWRDPNVIAKAADNLTIKFDKRNFGNERLSLDNFTPPVILPESLKTLQTIWKGENVSAAQLLTKLAVVGEQKQADEIIAALLSIGGDVKESLAVSLNSDNPILLKNAIRGLNAAISRDEIFLLFPIAFSKKKTTPDEIKNEAYNIILSKLNIRNKNNIRNDIQKKSVQVLYNRARDYYSRNRHLRADEDGNIRFWNWNEQKSCAEYIQLSLPDAYRLFAFRYATYAYKIADERGIDFDLVRRFYISALFEYVFFINGFDNPLDVDSNGLVGVVSSIPLVQLDRIMLDAISEEHFEVAIVAALIWGRVGNVKSFLSSAEGQPHPLIRAVSASDRRLRFTALETVMKLNPTSSYQGSSLVTDAIVWFSRADGEKKIVVVHPQLSEASRFAGFFVPLGYSAELASTCRKGFILATESPDVELVIVDAAHNFQEVSEFVRLLRKDNRTYNIPVAIFNEEPRRNPKIFQGNPNTMELKSMQQADRLSLFAPFSSSLSQSYSRPTSDATAQFIEADLLQKTGTIFVPSEIRVEQSRIALKWIKQTIIAAKDGRKIYHYENLENLVSRAVHSSQNAVEGLEIAAEIRSATMQSTIYNIAADATLPIEIRQKAAKLFETSIEKHGILLRGKQIQYLYDRYNASESEIKESQDLLSRIIDVVEDNASRKRNKK
ncbi:MAG: hypothetical protein LBB88_10375 [Planctomycetaceae bacterium]|nr:hypothetical protein [Planctomycetaceae bacterium]